MSLWAIQIRHNPKKRPIWTDNTTFPSANGVPRRPPNRRLGAREILGEFRRLGPEIGSFYDLRPMCILSGTHAETTTTASLSQPGPGNGIRKNVDRQEKGCNTRTSQEDTHPSTALAQARLTSEF